MPKLFKVLPLVLLQMGGSALLALPEPRRADQFVLIDVTFTFTNAGLDPAGRYPTERARKRNILIGNSRRLSSIENLVSSSYPPSIALGRHAFLLANPLPGQSPRASRVKQSVMRWLLRHNLHF
jgi:hypothetical protein